MKFKAIRRELCIFLLSMISLSFSKSFMDLAEQEVFKKDDYLSQSYRKEAASLNPEYYTNKGKEELGKCQDLFAANYDRCSRFNTCNLCSANSDCGWCNEKKLCIPVELNSKSDGIQPMCQGDCIRVLKIGYCYKGLFEAENTQGEVNFANYGDINEGNLFEKTLEKNINNEASHPLEGMTEEHVSMNSSNLNYLPRETSNAPLSVNLDEHHHRLYNDLTKISKEVFSDLVDEKVKNEGNQNFLIKYEPPKTEEEMMKYLKEYIPNYEFPQFVKSDLEGSIDQIKKEKLLLWLRGYSLNEPISKQHLPIYKNINFVDEDSVRKNLLDKFYKNIVKDPYSKVNSLVYKNMIGEKTLFGDNIRSNYHNVKNSHVVNSKFISPNDLKLLVKRNNIRFKEKDLVNTKVENGSLIGESNYKIQKINKNNNINTNTSGTKDNDEYKKANSNPKLNKHKTFKEISKELKEFLKAN
jgi:hypothetical protein